MPPLSLTNSTTSIIKPPKPLLYFSFRLPKRRGSALSIRSSRSAANGSSGRRPPFDLNLAIVLAGFAFEAYTSPPKDVGCREIDAAGCQTVFMSESFLREMYDGQLFVKVKKGLNLPAMDPWGTSDPYVVVQLKGQVVKSNTKWATKDPTWNEELALNIKKSAANMLQVAVWDANLVTPPKRMGNAGVDLVSLCDGNSHELLVELEGLGGGGKIQLEITYKSLEKIDEEKQIWKIPFVSDFLMQNNLASAMRMALGTENINVRQFVQSAFGQLNSYNSASLLNLPLLRGVSGESNIGNEDSNANTCEEQPLTSGMKPESQIKTKDNDYPEDYKCNNFEVSSSDKMGISESSVSDQQFWVSLASSINQNIFQNLGFALPEILKWDGFELLNRESRLSQQNAETEYVQSGLATPANIDNSGGGCDEETSTLTGIYPSLTDINKISRDLLGQTETIFGALMVLSTIFSQKEKDMNSAEEGASGADNKEVVISSADGETELSSKGSEIDKTKSEEMKKMFSSAESAMEAWAMLAVSLGKTSFIKSDFEKICFLDNDSTDTQVAIWRDYLQRRLVIAFRGTEQVRWKDLRTDLMLAPSGLNPERLGSNFKEEIQVHSGFLSAYDSVRNRIMNLIKHAIQFMEEDDVETMERWHVYVTGHSLGGALATLLALELSSSQMATCGAVSVTMYNFGSPRVGNKRFAEFYNSKVEDSWRIVNHRDIIPSVPRLMGYCHVAQPVYLAAGDFRTALANRNLELDEYQGDVIGEYTTDVLVNEFMKGEKELIEKILQFEINLLRSIRDGTALMQHMEDFYYITLLESVRSNYKTTGSVDADK